MRKQTRHRLQIVCGLGILLLTALLLSFALTEVKWVGSTDLTVEFVVTDAETGEPIKGAELQILSWGGLNADAHRLKEAGQEQEEFKLTTDKSGVAARVCPGCMSAGTDSLFQHTFGAHLPYWHVSPRAEGYFPGEAFLLGSVHRPQDVKRAGPKQAKLVVPIALHKSRP